MTTLTTRKSLGLSSLLALVSRVFIGAVALTNAAFAMIAHLAFGALVLIAIVVARLLPAAFVLLLVRRLC